MASSIGRRARRPEARGGPAGTGGAADRRGGAWHVAGETPRRLGVCTCMGKRRVSGGAARVRRARLWRGAAGPKLCHCTPV
jgi:hypothetical protein